MLFQAKILEWFCSPTYVTPYPVRICFYEKWRLISKNFTTSVTTTHEKVLFCFWKLRHIVKRRVSNSFIESDELLGPRLGPTKFPPRNFIFVKLSFVNGHIATDNEECKMKSTRRCCTTHDLPASSEIWHMMGGTTVVPKNSVCKRKMSTTFALADDRFKHLIRVPVVIFGILQRDISPPQQTKIFSKGGMYRWRRVVFNTTAGKYGLS